MSTLIILSFTPQISWPHGGSTATLRIQYSADFQDSEGQQVLRGMPQNVTCSVAGTMLTVPQFNLITTNDADVNALVTCSARFYDANGTPRDWLFQNFVIPQLLAPSATIGALRTYNQGAGLVLPPEFYLDRDETLALINNVLAGLGLAAATNLALGIVKLSAAAGDPANPVVWEQGDPNARDAQKLKSVLLDALMAAPANGNVIGYDAASTTWKPQASATPALHAASHENGGLDEIVVTGLSGLLADAQVPLAHAASHQNAGADEMSVTGLSGLLADAQTPLAHAASHENGGADEISVAGLNGVLADPQPPIVEDVQDIVGAMMTDSATVDFSYDDGAGTETADVKDDSITYAKMQNVSAASRLLGRGSAAGAGDPEEISLGTGISLVGTQLNATGLGGTVTTTGTPASGDITQFSSGTTITTATATGTGDVVRATSPTLVTPVLGTPASGNLSNCTVDGTSLVGFRNLPQRSSSVDTTTVLADAGGHLYHPTSDDNPRTFTIDANANVPYVIGTAITFINDQNTLTIAIDSDELVWAEDGSTGSRTLAENGIATAVKVDSTRWIISGTGLS